MLQGNQFYWAESSVAAPQEFEPGITQIEFGGSHVDLTVGQPDRTLLRPSLLAGHVRAALAKYGSAALAYGANAGPSSARSALATWAGRSEGGVWSAAEVLVTAGATQALDLLCHHLGRDGDHVLVQRTSYNLGLRLLRQHGLRPLPVGGDVCLPTADEVIEAARAVSRRAGRVAFAYFIPTFHNPTGGSWSLRERLEILAACQSLGITIVEDDPYRELFYLARPPPSLAMLGKPTVIGVRTLSKIWAPGLRVGWVLADRELISELSETPLFASGGGIAHIAALATEELLLSEEFALHLSGLREQYRLRRDALLTSIEKARLLGATWDCPTGGFFLWLRLPDELSASEVVSRARRRGVALLDGRDCWTGDNRDESLRLSFSAYRPAELIPAAEIVVSVLEEMKCAGHRHSENIPSMRRER